ncbi:MAG: hypothetical protein M3014_00350, partial [Chloroflexota bacterium]|nr:hypothetical protein [Chloroflexota bacterium]
DNTVRNVHASGDSVAMFNHGGSGIMANNTVSEASDAISSNYSKGIQFLNNTVRDSSSGVHTDNAGANGGVADVIRGNRVTHCMPNGYGVWTFVSYIAPLVDNNTIIDCSVGLAAFGQIGTGTTHFTNNTVQGTNKPGSYGAYVSTEDIGFGTYDVSVEFTGNTLKNNETGFHLEQTAGRVASATLHSNNLVGNSMAGLSTSAGSSQVNATLNYWGSHTGPTNVANPSGRGDAVVGNVTFTPWSTKHIGPGN